MPPIAGQSKWCWAALFNSLTETKVCDNIITQKKVCIRMVTQTTGYVNNQLAQKFGGDAMEFGKRLKSYRLNKGYTQKELSALIGVSEVTIGNWEREVKTPNLGALFALASTLQVSLDTLTGFPMPETTRQFTLEHTERSLIEKYRELDRYGKQAVDMICNVEFARISAKLNETIQPSGKIIDFSTARGRERYIPAYTSPSAAGFAVPLEGDEFEMILADESVPSDADFAVRIQGDSMAPYIEDGAMVFVNKDAEITNGDVGIFSVDGAMYCKQFFKDNEGNVHLLSANPDRISANVYLSVDCGSELRASGKVIIGSIPLPDYFDI